MDEFGKLRLTLLDETGFIIDRYEIPLDDLFEETIRAFAEEVYDASASKVMMVRIDAMGNKKGYGEAIDVDEYFERFIDSLIEEYYEDSSDDNLQKEVEKYGF